MHVVARGGSLRTQRCGRLVASILLALALALPDTASAAPAKSTRKRTTSSTSTAASRAAAKADSLRRAELIALADSAREATLRVGELEATVKRLEKRLEETSALALSGHNRLEQIESRGPADSIQQALAARIAELESTVRREPEAANEKLTYESFPGSILIPGTDAAIKIGGQARFVFAYNNEALGSEGRFVTSSIPIAGTEAAGKGGRATLSANPSRFSFDIRSPTDVGYIRAFIEGDFRGEGDVFRLRHAFGQWRGMIVGQTWSTFSDPDAQPDGIDLEGLNAISLFRQGQARLTTELNKENTWLSVAFEDPAPSITGAQGISQVPDLIARVRWRPSEGVPLGFLRGGHLQASLLLRQLRGEAIPNETLSTAGFGGTVSGRLPTPWSELDHILFATYGGTGIGRYITDLAAEGGQDAVFDSAANDLAALPVLSGYVGVEHWWGKTTRSTITFGTVVVDNLEIQAPGAYHNTFRGSLNFVWSPITRLDLVVEALTGSRENKDGQEGHASQLQIGSRLIF